MTNTNMLDRQFSYVLICGSYENKRDNDLLCEYLGVELAKSGLQIMSGGGPPGMRVGESMAEALDVLDKYHYTKILTVLRHKPRSEEIKVKTAGVIVFVGRNTNELRKHLVTNAWAVVVIGGKAKTKLEVLAARKLKLPVIPIEVSGGFASELWQKYYHAGEFDQETLFLQLKSKNLLLTAKAAVEMLISLNAKSAEITGDSFSHL